MPIPVGREEIVDRSGEKTQKAAPVGASDRRGFLRVHEGSIFDNAFIDQYGVAGQDDLVVGVLDHQITAH